MSIESNQLTESKIIKALDWAYDKAVNGIPGFGTAQDLANDFLKGDKPLDKKINSLVRWQKTKAATTGFITGLGGALTLPLTIPADLASTLFIQIRMIAAIAFMKGYNIKDDRIRTLIYVCLTGNAAKDLISQFSIKLGEKFLKEGIKKISTEALKKINKAVGIKLLTKFGEKGILNIGKMIPIAGGVINGGLDIMSTTIIGKTAKKVFE